MLNRLNKCRFPIREKVGFVFCNTTFQIEANEGITSFHFKEKWTEFFAWIYESELTNSDPLIPRTIWGTTGLDFLKFIKFIQNRFNELKHMLMNKKNKNLKKGTKNVQLLKIKK